MTFNVPLSERVRCHGRGTLVLEHGHQLTCEEIDDAAMWYENTIVGREKSFLFMVRKVCDRFRSRTTLPPTTIRSLYETLTFSITVLYFEKNLLYFFLEFTIGKVRAYLLNIYVIKCIFVFGHELDHSAR